MDFTLRIFESEYDRIREFVLKYPNIETGGDLFGLWTSNNDPVVQLLIGPGENCRRTSVSFHQDVKYLSRVGVFVNTSYMLCHIGSWHSHHHLSLDRPSAGDHSTVCNNFPAGLKRYIMIIVNIRRNNTVDVTPYMFLNRGHVCKRGRVDKIKLDTPFRKEAYILKQISEGAEALLPGVTDDGNLSRYSKSAYSSREKDIGGPLQWYEGKNGENKMKKLVEGLQEKLKPKPEIMYERDTLSNNLTMTFNHAQKTWIIHFPCSYDREKATIQLSSRDDPIRSRDILGDIRKTCGCMHCKPDRDKSRMCFGDRIYDEGDTPWSQTDDGKQTLEKIKQNLGDALCNDIKMKPRKKSLGIKIHFSHNDCRWKVKFPARFPEETCQVKMRKDLIGKIYCSESDPYQQACSITKDILAKVQEKCSCDRCKPSRKPASYSRHSANLPARNTWHRPQPLVNYGTRGLLRPHRHIVSEEVPDGNERKLLKIHTALSAQLVNGGNVDIYRDLPSRDIRMEFDHGGKHWRIVFPPNNTDNPEIGYYDSYGRYTSADQRGMPEDVVSIIRRVCGCSACKRAVYYC